MASSSTRRKAAVFSTFCVKKETNAKYRQVAAALQKPESDRTDEERDLLTNNVDLVQQASERQKKRQEVKARSEEVEDPEDVLVLKCKELAVALRSSKHLVVYTGAGISTAAKIPDYRGTNGIWTLLQKGKDIGSHDLSQAEPTLTHMALYQLYIKGLLKYVVSQNCDGLHLRSGLPRCAISEVHGNMHIEVCRECRPCLQYWRLFDVTENTGRFSHRTMRRCHICHSALLDTIVHFGERGSHPWPLNWPSASKAADDADVILCIGSSLKVLKKYPWLWGMDKPARKRPKLYIINLQWTPKDDHAVLKINGRCDRIMLEVMKHLDLEIPNYDRFRDPIFVHATWLHPGEEHTTSQPELDSPIKREVQDAQVDEPPPKKVKFTESSSTHESTTLKRSIKKEDPGYEEEHKNVDTKISPSELAHDMSDIAQTCIKHVVNACEIKLEALDDFEVKKKEDSFQSAKRINGDPLLDVNVDLKSCSECFPEKANKSSLSPKSGKTVIIEETPCFAADSDEKLTLTIEETIDTDSCDNMRNDSSFNKAHRLPEKVRRETPSEDFDSPASEGKENRDVIPSESVPDNTIKSVSKTSSRDKNGKNTDSSLRKENGSDDHLENEDSSMSKDDSNCIFVSKNSKSNTALPNGLNSNSLKNTDVAVLRNLQVEHNYSKVLKTNLKTNESGNESEKGIDEEAAPTRTSSRVREKRTIAIAAAQTAKKEEPPPIKAAPKTSQNKSDKNKIDKADYEIKAMKCSFCQENYLSPVCLFYPSFNTRPRKFEGCICECCDYSESEEEVEEEEEESKEGRNSDNGEEQPSKTQVINPGWYGKGYRKRNMKRRK